METLAFWGAIAVITVSGLYFNKLRIDSRQKSIRELFDKSNDLDEKTLDKFLDNIQKDDNNQRPLEHNLKLASPIIAFSGLGVCAFSYLGSNVIGEAWTIILSGGCFMVLNGLGMYFAGHILTNLNADNK